MLPNIALKLLRSPTTWIVLLVAVTVGYGSYQWIRINNQLNESMMTAQLTLSRLELSEGKILKFEEELRSIKERLVERDKISNELNQTIREHTKGIAKLQLKFSEGLNAAREAGAADTFVQDQIKLRLECLEIASAAKTIRELNNPPEKCQ